MFVYTSAKLSNYFLGAVSSRFFATSKSNKCIIISLWKSTDSLMASLGVIKKRSVYSIRNLK